MADLTSMLLEVGTSLEEADMGDSFVDAWTVANKVCLRRWETTCIYVVMVRRSVYRLVGCVIGSTAPALGQWADAVPITEAVPRIAPLIYPFNPTIHPNPNRCRTSFWRAWAGRCAAPRPRSPPTRWCS